MVEVTMAKEEEAIAVTIKEKKKKCDLRHKGKWQKDIIERTLQSKMRL